jgi:hypothetical protein
MLERSSLGLRLFSRGLPDAGLSSATPEGEVVFKPPPMRFSAPSTLAAC